MILRIQIYRAIQYHLYCEILLLNAFLPAELGPGPALGTEIEEIVIVIGIVTETATATVTDGEEAAVGTEMGLKVPEPASKNPDGTCLSWNLLKRTSMCLILMWKTGNWLADDQLVMSNPDLITDYA